jgi:hypothetical protein
MISPNTMRAGFLMSIALSAFIGYGQTPPPASHVGVFRSGYFWVLDVNGDNQFSQSTNPPDIAFGYGGIAGDIPITGDWNGNGFTEVGIYRPHSGLFILDTNGNGQIDAGDQIFNLGVGQVAGDIPVVGDWNGDGRTKVGLFRGGNTWLLDYNGDGVFGSGDKTYYFGGISGDIPVVGDWTGSGTSKIGVFRDGFEWVLDANGNGTFDGTGPGQDYVYAFGGIGGDVPVVGDWSVSGTGPGSGMSKIGIFRNGHEWVLDSNGDGSFGSGDASFSYGGISGDIPVAGKWNAAEQSTDTQPVCVSSSGSCMATP